jgi:hypothetical protein
MLEAVKPVCVTEELGTELVNKGAKLFLGAIELLGLGYGFAFWGAVACRRSGSTSIC